MSRTALYRHFDGSGRLLYVGITDCLHERDRQHAATKRWHADVVRTETQWCLSREHAADLERVAIKHEAPLHNVTLVRAVEQSAVALRPRANIVGDCALADFVRSRPAVPMQAWADHFEISRPYLYALLDGSRDPSLAVAARIERATGGAVKITAWPNLKAVIEAARGAA